MVAVHLRGVKNDFCLVEPAYIRSPIEVLKRAKEKVMEMIGRFRQMGAADELGEYVGRLAIS
jgi:hypothetical protein